VVCTTVGSLPGLTCTSTSMTGGGGGGATRKTWMVTEALDEAPAESDAVAVRTWVPSVRVEALTLSSSPVPSAPSRSDDHDSAAPVRAPSSGSNAAAMATSCNPENTAPPAGPSITTWGALSATENGLDVAEVACTPSEAITCSRALPAAFRSLRGSVNDVSPVPTASVSQVLPSSAL
jgi:hypothetical protein